MSLNIALFNALTGLRVNQQSIDFTAQNVANANTEGYSRKIVQQTSLIHEGIGAGVDIKIVTREVNEFLLRDMRGALNQFEEADVQNEFYSRMQDLFGALNSNGSPGALIAELGSRIQAWAVTPENLSLRTEIVSRAQFLTERVNQIAGNIRALFDAVVRAKPSGSKGMYIKKVSLTSTMGPGVRIDPASMSEG